MPITKGKNSVPGKGSKRLPHYIANQKEKAEKFVIDAKGVEEAKRLRDQVTSK